MSGSRRMARPCSKNTRPGRPATAGRTQTRNKSVTGYFIMLVVVNEIGAVPDGQTDCTAAIQRAIDTAAGMGGGMVYFPAGKYVTGTLWLKSNITLMIEPGATLLGSQDVNAFPEWTPKW